AELEATVQDEHMPADQDAAQRDQQCAAPPAGATAQAEAARAATAAAAALQQEEEEALPLTEDGFIDLERLTAKQHQRYNTLVNDILTEAQQERYSAFRRSTLKKPIQALMTRMLGGPVPNNSKALIALASVTKSFVDDLVAAAMAVAEERGEGTPLQPAHIHEAYQRLIAADKEALEQAGGGGLAEPDLEWKLTYVGSAENEKYDQVLDTVFVGPVAPGQYRFVFQADPPEFSQIPPDDIVGVTVILLTCSYREKEFIRVGYYVNNEYAEEELRDNPPDKPAIDRLYRNILADKPRVTKFNIDWDSTREASGLQSGMEVDS
ncbi:hypothetical protein COHA_009047, partial [Chlorella ohadii]